VKAPYFLILTILFERNERNTYPKKV